jgi:hypothetical protein
MEAGSDGLSLPAPGRPSCTSARARAGLRRGRSQPSDRRSLRCDAAARARARCRGGPGGGGEARPTASRGPLARTREAAASSGRKSGGDRAENADAGAGNNTLCATSALARRGPAAGQHSGPGSRPGHHCNGPPPLAQALALHAVPKFAAMRPRLARRQPPQRAAARPTSSGRCRGRSSSSSRTVFVAVQPALPPPAQSCCYVLSELAQGLASPQGSGCEQPGLLGALADLHSACGTCCSSCLVGVPTLWGAQPRTSEARSCQRLHRPQGVLPVGGVRMGAGRMEHRASWVGGVGACVC